MDIESLKSTLQELDRALPEATSPRAVLKCAVDASETARNLALELSERFEQNGEENSEISFRLSAFGDRLVGAYDGVSSRLDAADQLSETEHSLFDHCVENIRQRSKEISAFTGILV